MTALEQTIISDYETNGTSLEQIAQDTNLTPIVVKAVLLRYSAKFREQLAGKPVEAQVVDEDVSDTDFAAVKRVIRELALYAESENVRSKMALFLFNEKKGRNAQKADILKGARFNILTLNEGIQKAREALTQGNLEALKQIEATILHQTSEVKKTE